MNRSSLYLIFVFALLAILLNLRAIEQNRPIVLQKNGLQFTNLKRSHLIQNPQENDVFIINGKDSNARKVYKVDEPFSGSGMRMLLCNTPPEQLDNDALFLSAINGNLTFDQQLKSVNYYDRIDLIGGQKEVIARRLLQHEYHGGIVDYVDESPIIFLIIIGLLVGLLLMIDIVSKVFYFFFKKDINLFTKLLVIIGVMAFLATLVAAESFITSKAAATIRVIIIFIPLFILFQYFLKPWINNKAFSDQEFAKFMFIFFGGIVTIYLGTSIANFVDKQFFNGSIYTRITETKISGFDIALLFSFAMANFINNFRKYFFELRSSANESAQSKALAASSTAELNALQSSVNPHFLYNSLNSIASLATVDAEKTEEMAMSLSAFYKYMTNRSDEHLSTLGEEVELVETYVKIEKIRFGDRLKVNIDVPKNLNALKIPRFILQPLVENAIKYGYNKIQKSIDIKLEVRVERGHLVLRIFDKGKAFQDNMQTGYGLKSVTQKLNLLFPNQHELAFKNSPEKHVFISIKKAKEHA